MILIPQPKPVRIRLSIDQQNGDGKVVYFRYEDLLKDFDFQALIPHIVDNSLIKWLEQIGNNDISVLIRQILGEQYSEESVKQHKHQIISVLFNDIISESVSTDHEFLTALLNLSTDYRRTIKNLLASDSFSQYSEYDFLKSLLPNCAISFKRILDDKLETLQREEELRIKYELIEKEKETKSRRSSTKSKKVKNIEIYSPASDYVSVIKRPVNSHVNEGDIILSLRTRDIPSPCRGVITKIGVIPGVLVTEHTLLAVIEKEEKIYDPNKIKKIVSPCKGQILGIRYKEGQFVKKGERIIIFASFDITAPCDGIVLKVLATTFQKVYKDDTLLIFEAS